MVRLTPCPVKRYVFLGQSSLSQWPSLLSDSRVSNLLASRPVLCVTVRKFKVHREKRRAFHKKFSGPRGIGWRGRREGGSEWGIHVTPWLIHVNVWQNPLQYCEMVGLQLIKINGKKNKFSGKLLGNLAYLSGEGRALGKKNLQNKRGLSWGKEPEGDLFTDVCNSPEIHTSRHRWPWVSLLWLCVRQVPLSLPLLHRPLCEFTATPKSRRPGVLSEMYFLSVLEAGRLDQGAGRRGSPEATSSLCPHVAFPPLHPWYLFVQLFSSYEDASWIGWCCCSVAKSVWLFATPRTAAPQASLSFTVFQSLLRFISIELVMLSNHLILYLLLP